MVDYYKTKSNLVNWSRATEVKNRSEQERKKLVDERQKIRVEWADYLLMKRQVRLGISENVTPGNAKAGESDPFAEVELALDEFPNMDVLAV